MIGRIIENEVNVLHIKLKSNSMIVLYKNKGVGALENLYGWCVMFDA